MDRGASAPGEIWTVGAFLHIPGGNMVVVGDAIRRCSWLTMTYMDVDGVVRAVEIPAGGVITVTAEDLPAEPNYVSGTEVDIMAIPPVALSALSADRGIRLTIEVRRGTADGALLRLYGRP